MPTTTDVTSTVRVLELELTLLARHQLSTVNHYTELGLDRSGYQLLCRLEVGAMTLKQLAAAFRLDISTVNRQVASLRHKGLVERVSDPSGGLAQLLQPTASGLELLAHDRNIKRENISRLVEAWDPDEVETLHRMLAKLNTEIEDREGQPWPRP